MGIITHDDVIDAFREEATEDAQLAAAVAPLEEGYMQTSLVTLWWKRGVWLTVLFVTAMFTATALRLLRRAARQVDLAGDVHPADHGQRRQHGQSIGHADHHRHDHRQRRPSRLGARSSGANSASA